MEQLIERIAKAPLGLKIGVVAGALVLVTALSYFVFSIPWGPSISEVETRIKKTMAEQARLERDFTEKQAIANDLNRFRKEKELLEQRLAEALAELPEEKNIDELLQLFQDRAQKAGLEIATITPEAEKSEGFYARIPIPMTVTGNFHEIATFFDSLGRLRRIVNVSDISMTAPKDVGGKMVVDAKFLVTTFMFVNQAKTPPGAKKGAGQVNRLRLTALAALLAGRQPATSPSPGRRHPRPPPGRPRPPRRPPRPRRARRSRPRTWSYSSVGKRDPFRSFLAESRGGGAALVTRCATPLGRYELEQLRLVAVITGLEDPVAMVQAPNGTGYTVRRGSCIGKNGGSVAAVRTGEVVVAEWVTRADGTRDRTQTVLSLPKREVINLEESP